MKAQSVEWFIEAKLDFSEERVAKRHHQNLVQTAFRETGSGLHKRGTGRSRVSDRNVERTRRDLCPQTTKVDKSCSTSKVINIINKHPV